MSEAMFGPTPEDPRIDPDIDPPDAQQWEPPFVQNPTLVGAPGTPPPSGVIPTPPPLGKHIKEQEAEEEPEELQFDPKDMEQFKSLLTVGSLDRVIDLFDHKVHIRTLCCDDELMISQFTKDYVNTDGYSRAYQIGVCAAGIVEINGVPLATSLEEKPTKESLFTKRAEKLKEYKPVVVNQIYNKITGLEVTFFELAKRLGKLPG